MIKEERVCTFLAILFLVVSSYITARVSMLYRNTVYTLTALRFGIEICFVLEKLFRFGVQAVTVEPTVDGLAAVTSLLIQFPG